MEKEMSELMDLDFEKANRIVSTVEKEHYETEWFRVEELKEMIAEALFSERQRMIEKFRPVVKAFDQLVNPNVRHQCTHGILLDSVWFQGAQEALALWKEIEKENL